MCTGKLINKDYRYLYEMCVETGARLKLCVCGQKCVILVILKRICGLEGKND